MNQLQQSKQILLLEYCASIFSLGRVKSKLGVCEKCCRISIDFSCKHFKVWGALETLGLTGRITACNTTIWHLQQTKQNWVTGLSSHPEDFYKSRSKLEVYHPRSLPYLLLICLDARLQRPTQLYNRNKENIVGRRQDLHTMFQIICLATQHSSAFYIYIYGSIQTRPNIKPGQTKKTDRSSTFLPHQIRVA